MPVDKVSLVQILALEGDEIHTDFAWGGQIEHDVCSPTKFRVENVEYSVPLSFKDLESLVETRTLIDASNTWELHQVSNTFFTESVPTLTSMVLNNLGLDSVGVQTDVDRVILYRSGAKLKRRVDLERKSGIFARMVLQIPVEGGFHGGRLHVEHHSRVKTFDFSADSHANFYAAIFYADCGHDMEPIKSGWRLVIVFNLAWKTSLRDFCTEEIPIFSKTLTQLRKILEPWQDEEGPRLLAVPLKHKYPKTNLSFAALKGRDLWMAALLQSTDLLDIHLTVLSKHQQGTDASEGHDQSDLEEDEHAMKEVLIESYETGKLWIAVNEKPVHFEQLDIDQDTEVLGEVKSLFDLNPDVKEFQDYPGGAGPIVEYWYYRAVLVIWPKKRSVDMALRFGLDGAFDLVERLADSPSTKGEAADALRRILDYCGQHPSRMWYQNTWNISPDRTPNKSGQRSERLLKICIELDAKAESLLALNYLATEFNVEHADDTSGLNYVYFANAPITFAAGILTRVAAESIAELIKMNGWQFYSEIISRLLCPSRAKSQMGQYAHLVSCLLDQKCLEAAVPCGQRVIALLFSSELDIFDELDSTALQSCASMIFKMEENPQLSSLDAARQFTCKLHMLTVEKVCDLILNIRETCESHVKTTLKPLEFYKSLCHHLLFRDFDFHEGMINKIGDIFKCFVWLGDPELLQSLAQKLMNSQNKLLEAITLSEDVKDCCMSSLEGRNVFQTLLDFQISELESEVTEPAFTWEQPDAVFAPHHPQVQYFLRSPSRSITYINFNGIRHARNFAAKYFRPESIDRGYSSTAEPGGIGKKAFCRIEKTRDLYESRLQQCRRSQQKLQSLKEIRRQTNFPDIATDEKGSETGGHGDS